MSTRSRDLKRRGPIGLGRTLTGDRRSDRNAALQSTSRLAARAVTKLAVGPEGTANEKRIADLERLVNDLSDRLKAAGLMETL
jgi:hypothetical protein